MAQPLATSSRGSLPPLRLHLVRDPSLRVRQAVRDNNVPLLNRLQNKTDLRNTDRARLTSLSWAALEGSLEVFEWLLLDYGHDDQELSRDADNNTILHLLAAIPSLSVSPHTRLLLSSPSFPPRPSNLSLSAQSTISLRMTQLYHTLFPFLLDWSNAGGKTALHVAAQAGNASFISLLCDLGADPDLTDLQGNTPLHYAAAWGHLDTIRVLLERGCQFAARNAEGFTASDFAYSERIMSGLQNIAREIFENRRAKRKEERNDVRPVQGQPHGQTTYPAQGGGGERTRSGSVSTSASMGSGLGMGNNSQSQSQIYGYGHTSNQTFQSQSQSQSQFNEHGHGHGYGYGERTSSLPMVRRGSDSQSQFTTNTSTSANSNASISFPIPTPLMARPKHLQNTSSTNGTNSINGPMGPPPVPPLPPIQTQLPNPVGAGNRYPSPISQGPPQVQKYPSPIQPQPYRSPSLPGPTPHSTSSTSIPRSSPSPKINNNAPANQESTVPPVPTPPEGLMMGSVMRRANSAQVQAQAQAQMNGGNLQR